jgi:hypothetical protein
MGRNADVSIDLYIIIKGQETILQLGNLQLHRQRCSKLERFFKEEFFSKKQQAPRGGRFFVHFFPGKISGKIPRKISPQKCWEKMEFSAEKSFEKSFFQQIPRNFPRKITFRGKK